MQHGEIVAHASVLSQFIRERANDLLAEWEKRVREVPSARKLDRPALLDHVPNLLDLIAELAAQIAGGATPELPRRTAEQHALERLDEGFDLAEVVLEYSLLREVIVEAWEGLSSPEVRVGTLTLNRAIDRAVAASVDRYAHARDRTLNALDRIARAAFHAGTLDELLDRLLRVFAETTAAVDTAVIMLREGDYLVVRAAVGLEADTAPGRRIPIGQGFAGAIAQDGNPRMLRASGPNDLVQSDTMLERGVRSLYGVPLLDDEHVIGVVHVGSSSAYDLADQDRHLMVAMANRIAAGIVIHQVREVAEQRAKDLERVVRAREDVLAIVSHDLRNPLDAINLATYLLFRQPLPSHAQGHVETIQRATRRMARLIDDLLDMASIQAGRLRIEKQRYRASDIVLESVEENRPAAMEKGVSLECDCDIRDREIQCDRERIMQAMGNLIGNAIKFCKPGDEIHVRAKIPNDRLHVAVSDTGPGIPPEELAHLFEPYWSSARHQRSGVGLGLFITRGIIEAHGGTIRVESEIEKGTTFHVELPLD